MEEKKISSSTAKSKSSELDAETLALRKSCAYYPSSSYTPNCGGGANMTKKLCKNCHNFVNLEAGYITMVKDYLQYYFCCAKCHEEYKEKKMYRPKWFPKENDILTIALNVHGFMSGAFVTSLECHALNMKALKYVIANWKDNKYNKFEEAVKNIIKIAIQEGEKND